MKYLDSFLLGDEDWTCSTTDDWTSNKFEQAPQQKTKTDPDGLCQSQKNIGLLSEKMNRLTNMKLSFTKIKRRLWII